MHPVKPPRSSRAAYPIPEFAELFGISRQHVYNLIARGDLRSVTLGTARRIPASEVERLLGEAA